jgi:predicted nucleic acid-binding protein
MMTEGNAVFIDTNILVYANLALSPFHAQAVERLQTLDNRGIDLWISRQVLREYLSAMTRPGDLTGQIPIASLAADISYFTDYFHIAEDSSEVTGRLLSLIEQIPTGGRQIHDANLVATMQLYGIQNFLTHNIADFDRFSQVITVLPLIETA